MIELVFLSSNNGIMSHQLARLALATIAYNKDIMIIESIWHALSKSLAMGWEILWPLILGFALSGVIQAIVSHRQTSRLLP